jgi:hypothetical protein
MIILSVEGVMETFNFVPLVLSAEISCLAHGTPIGYSSPLTLTDQVGLLTDYANFLLYEVCSSISFRFPDISE